MLANSTEALQGHMYSRLIFKSKRTRRIMIIGLYLLRLVDNVSRKQTWTKCTIHAKNATAIVCNYYDEAAHQYLRLEPYT